MTNIKRNIMDFTSADQSGWSLCSVSGDAELEKLDREAGHEYVPMDVFVDPETIKEHFQASSISARWTESHHVHS